MLHLPGMFGIDLRGCPASEEDTADLADARSAALDGQKSCRDEEFAPLRQEVARRALVRDGEEIIRDLGKLGIALLEVLDTG